VTTGGVGPVAGTTPYPWPYDGGCPGGRLALVVAGWDHGWRRRVTGPDAAAVEPTIAALAAAVAAAGGQVVTLAHAGPPRLARLDAAPAPGAAPGAPPALAGAVHLVTGGLDGFWGSGLDPTLRSLGVTHLLVAGHGLEGPVHSTMRGANDMGYECLLVLDAATVLVPDLAGPSRSMVEMSGGIFGAVGRSADVVAALRPPSPVTPAPALLTEVPAP
jgi:biuret amidohydrolase